MSTAQKTPLSRSLSTFAQKKALDEIAKRGMALPGHVVAVSGQIVTVNFDVDGVTLPQIKMPLATCEYIRIPVQIGDLGVAEPADVYLGGISGLGGGRADLTLRGNLSALVWKPVANSNWTAPPGSDANTLALYGKLALLLLESITGSSSVKLTSAGITLAFAGGSIAMTSSGITLGFGGHTIVIDSAGVHIEGRNFLNHQHGNVQTGSGVSGGVV
jgi:hypothetical protein